MPMSWRPLALLGLFLLPGSSGQAAGPPIFRHDLYGDALPPGAIARMGTVRWRPREGLRALAFVPDGKHLATASDAVFSLWDLRTGKVVRTNRDGATPLEYGFSGGFAFTPDGGR